MDNNERSIIRQPNTTGHNGEAHGAPSFAASDAGHPLQELLRQTEEALSRGAYAAAQHCADSAISLDDKNSRAWELRAAASAGQTDDPETGTEEAVTAWITAAQTCDPADAAALLERIREAAAKYTAEGIKTAAGQFADAPGDVQLRQTLQTLSSGLRLINSLTAQLCIVFSCGTLFTRFARILTDAADAGFRTANADFGPAPNNMQRWQWEKYTEAGDACLRLLEKAVYLCHDNDLGKRTCDLYIQIGERIKESCAYRYADSAGDLFLPDRAFTAEAKRIRDDDIRSFRAKRGYFEADQVTRLCRELEQSRSESDALRAKEHYWEIHAEEKTKLLTETQKLQETAENANAQMNSLEAAAAREKAEENRRELEARYAALGLGKWQQKRSLRAEIAALSQRIAQLQTEEAQQKKALSWTIKKSNARMAEIRRIFSAPRGALASPAGAFTFRGKNSGPGLRISPQQLSDHLSGILPAPYRITGLRSAKKSDAPPAGFPFPGAFWQCGVTKDVIDAFQRTPDLRLFFFAKTKNAPLDAVLLETSAAADADESGLYDLGLLGSYLLLSVLSTPDQPTAEQAILRLRHGCEDTVFLREEVCAFYTCAEKTDLDGGTAFSDLILLLPVRPTPSQA